MIHFRRVYLCFNWLFLWRTCAKVLEALHTLNHLSAATPEQISQTDLGVCPSIKLDDIHDARIAASCARVVRYVFTRLAAASFRYHLAYLLFTWSTLY